MSFEIVEKSKVSREITLTVKGDDVRRAESQMVEQARKTMKVNGFRMGKVPASYIRERAGASIMEDARRECLQEAAREALATIENLIHVGEAEVVEAKTEDGGFVAKLTAEVTPTIELVDYKGIEVEVADAVVTDKDVDDAIEARREAHAVVKEVEGHDTVAEGDSVVVTLSAPNEAASKICRAGDRTLIIGKGILNKDMEACLVGVKKGDSVNLSAKIDDADAVVTAEVKEIKVRELPALDDEFAKDTGDAETLEGLKEKTRERLTQDAESERKAAIDAKLCDKLREMMPMEIPEGYVRARATQAIRLQLEQMMRQQLDESWVARIANNLKEAELVEYRNDYHVEIILNAIAAAEKIEVSLEDTLTEASKWFGGANKSQIERWLKTNNASSFVGDQVKRDRALDVVREASVIKPMTETAQG